MKAIALLNIFSSRYILYQFVYLENLFIYGHGCVSFSFYACVHLNMENLFCENKINLFQSVYYGLWIHTRSTQYDVTCQASIMAV